MQQNHYDAEGLRNAVTENGSTTNFVYRNGMLSSELDADRNPVRGYVYGNEYISQNNGSSSGYYLNDEQGSIRYLTGSDGSIRNHYRYSAFGESITAEETVPNRLKYNAQMADELTGLYYLRARYYNASLGRFTQEDVIYNDGLNLYAYCNSNPVMYSDPSGFAKETCKSKVGGECDSESGSETGPYAYLEDEPTVGAGKDFTAAQKQKMLEENMKRNGGVVKSDNPNDYYDVLTKPKKSMKGVTPEPNEWQFDHIKPKDQGGTNSYSNCQIVSRKYNREKWNK